MAFPDMIWEAIRMEHAMDSRRTGEAAGIDTQQMSEDISHKLVTAANLSKYFDVTTTTIYQWLARGRLPQPFRPPGKPMEWAWSEVLAFEADYKRLDSSTQASIASIDRRRAGSCIEEKVDALQRRVEQLEEQRAMDLHVRDLESDCVNRDAFVP